MDKDTNIGRLLDGRYEILEVLGTGGMAVVYKAKCHRLNRLVAIKILKEEFSQDEDFRRRFYGESQAVAMLSHPNIVSIYDVSSSKAAEYIVMELIDGITLKQYMEKKGVLNWKETLHFATQIAKALEHAHAKGIVHRDIKPHNVMVLKSGAIKVMDFGIAQTMTSGGTKTKEALGSVHYISPEQAKGGRVDNRSDIYSLGVVMYEMVAGRVPYDGDNPVNIALQHLNGKAEQPSVYNPNIPRGLEQIIMKAMALMAKDRYITATAMLYDLDEFRKNPEKLFVLPPLREDGTLVMPEGRVITDPTKKTQGETAPLPKPIPPRPQPKPVPEDDEDEDPEERPSRVVTVAIVSCIVVGLVALIIFLILLGQSGLFSKPQMVTIPNLVGQEYSSLQTYEGINIVCQDRQYNSHYPAGQIIYQVPYAGEEKQAGTTVRVIVSLGEEPPAKTMPDLSNMTQTEAKAALDQLLQGLNVIIKTENSDTVEADRVTRTEPSVGTVLKKGDNVYLYISLGAEVRVETIPTVVGRDVTVAQTILGNNGFANLRIEYLPSTKPKDQVLSQSVDGGELVNVTTEIVLVVSSGESTAAVPNVAGMTLEEAVQTLNGCGFGNLKVTTVDSTVAEGLVVSQSAPAENVINVDTEIVLFLSSGIPPKEPDPPQPVEMEVVFLLEQKEEAYTLTVKQGDTVITELTVPAQQTQVTLTLTGNGVQVYDLYIGDTLIKSETVDFEPHD